MGDIDVSDFTSGLLHALGPTLGPSGRAAATRALQDFAQTTGLQNSNDACDDRVVTLLLNESSIGQAHTDGEAWKEVANLMSLSLCSKDLRNLLLAVRLCLSEALVGATIQSATTKREVWELIDQLHKACWSALTPAYVTRQLAEISLLRSYLVHFCAAGRAAAAPPATPHTQAVAIIVSCPSTRTPALFDRAAQQPATPALAWPWLLRFCSALKSLPPPCQPHCMFFKLVHPTHPRHLGCGA